MMQHSLKQDLVLIQPQGIINNAWFNCGFILWHPFKACSYWGVVIIADTLSDALGIHVSEESENKHTKRDMGINNHYVWS